MKKLLGLLLILVGLAVAVVGTIAMKTMVGIAGIALIIAGLTTTWSAEKR
jgi:hypothetical protein